MISFDKTEFILGNHKLGEFVTAIVTVTNNSPQTVELVPANSSCSCTSGVVQTPKLAAGQKTLFTITVSTSKAGKGANQVKSISLGYKLGKQQLSQVFRVKLSVI